MSDPLELFIDHYYRRRPVNATFTGVHDYDAQLPDWSPSGLAALDDEMRQLIVRLDEAYPAPANVGALRDDVNLLDAELARGFCEIQLSESASGHGVRGNPALWTGEAVFSVVSLISLRSRFEGQRVDRPADVRPEHRVHAAVLLDPAHAGELRRKDAGPEMVPAAGEVGDLGAGARDGRLDAQLEFFGARHEHRE